MSISALIIDDEQLAREELKYLLDSVGGVDVVAQGANGIEAVDLIEEHHPDLVFLDVQMPGQDGFAVIQRLIERNRVALRSKTDREGCREVRRQAQTSRRQLCRILSLPRPTTSTRCAPSM